MSLQYLIDENVNPIYSQQIQQRESQIVVQSVGEPGTPTKVPLEPEILDWCEQSNFIMNIKIKLFTYH